MKRSSALCAVALLLASACGGADAGSLSTLRVNASRVAVLLYGSTYEACLPATAADLSRVFVQPLLAAGHSVHLHVTAPAAAHAKWESWLSHVEGAAEPAQRTLTALGPVGPFSESHYAHDCNPWHTSATHDHYHEHSAHMEQAWRAVEAYEKAQGWQYDFVLKSRCDLQFHPRQAFKACYLPAIDEHTLLTTDLEFFCQNRWNERGPGLGEGAWECSGMGVNPTPARSTFPEWMPDLFFFGHRQPMSVALTIDSAPMMMPCWDRNYTAREGYNRTQLVAKLGNNERLMAEHVFSHGISVYAVPLQLGKYVFGRGREFFEDAYDCGGHGGCWNMQPCLLCFVCPD